LTFQEQERYLKPFYQEMSLYLQGNALEKSVKQLT